MITKVEEINRRNKTSAVIRRGQILQAELLWHKSCRDAENTHELS